jgi:preprotein translocase subunit YajC
MLVWILVIGFMFYFLMIKPQKKARATQADMLQHLAVGSQVRTTAQIMGTVVELGEDFVVVETMPGTQIKFGKPAIVGIVLPDEPEDASDDESAENAADLPTPGGIGDAPAVAASVQDATPAAEAETVSAETAESAELKADDAKVDAESAAKS